MVIDILPRTTAVGFNERRGITCYGTNKELERNGAKYTYTTTSLGMIFLPFGQAHDDALSSVGSQKHAVKSTGQGHIEVKPQRLHE